MNTFSLTCLFTVITLLSYTSFCAFPKTNKIPMNKIDKIKSILYKHEEDLYDGYGYYCENTDEMIEKIAKEILENI